jgi:hypothetical protein
MVIYQQCSSKNRVKEIFTKLTKLEKKNHKNLKVTQENALTM